MSVNMEKLNGNSNANSNTEKGDNSPIVSSDTKQSKIVLPVKIVLLQYVAWLLSHLKGDSVLDFDTLLVEKFNSLSDNDPAVLEIVAKSERRAKLIKSLKVKTLEEAKFDHAEFLASDLIESQSSDKGEQYERALWVLETMQNCKTGMTTDSMKMVFGSIFVNTKHKITKQMAIERPSNQIAGGSKNAKTMGRWFKEWGLKLRTSACHTDYQVVKTKTNGIEVESLREITLESLIRFEIDDTNNEYVLKYLESLKVSDK